MKQPKQPAGQKLRAGEIIFDKDHPRLQDWAEDALKIPRSEIRFEYITDPDGDLGVVHAAGKNGHQVIFQFSTVDDFGDQARTATWEATVLDDGVRVEFKAPPAPEGAEKLLYLLPKNTRDPILGDLEEQYPRWCREWGVSSARRFYWWHILAALGYSVVRALARLVSMFWRIGS